jgi:GIY-YIG catalytic domain
VTDTEIVESVVARLTDQKLAVPAVAFPQDPEAVAGAGLYSWWADVEGRAILGEPLGTILPALIYAGQSGATSRRAGVERVATLRSRIRTNHLNGNVRSSTFRKTLTSLLRDHLGLRLVAPDRLDEASNRAVTVWIRQHLAVATVRVDDRAELIDLEEAVLARLDPPLNLMGMPTTPTRRRLAALRRGLGQFP